MGLALEKLKSNQSKIDKYTYDEIEKFTKILFGDTFTEEAKSKSSKKVLDKTDNIVKFSEHLAWSMIGYVKTAGTKELDIKGSFGVRTYQSFLHHAVEEKAVFFTPNTFCSRKIYKKDLNHLRWINALVVDIDEDIEFDEVLLRIRSAKLPRPTAINKTPRGLHIYWFLKKRIPGWYQKNKELYSKLISAIQMSIGADPFAKSASNFYRIPKNINYFNENNRFTILKFKNWYKNLDREMEIKIKESQNDRREILNKEAIVKLMEGAQNGNRNLAAFSLAKVYQYIGKTFEEASLVMESWNKRNSPPLPERELIKRIKSAYNGDDQLPLNLIKEITGIKISIGNIKVFRKHKKERTDRIRHHKEEIINDLFFYLEKIGGRYEGSQKNLGIEIGKETGFVMAERSLKEVLKEFKNGSYRDEIFIEVIGRGRSSKTVIALRNLKNEQIKRENIRENCEKSCNTNVLHFQKKMTINQKNERTIINRETVEISTKINVLRKNKKRCNVPITIKKGMVGSATNAHRAPFNRLSTFPCSPQDSS